MVNTANSRRGGAWRVDLDLRPQSGDGRLGGQYAAAHLLGGACVTLNNTPLPLLATSPTQINAQLPPTLAAGRYPLMVRR